MDANFLGDNLLTEDDFKDFAAAVGESADGIDDNPRAKGIRMIDQLKLCRMRLPYRRRQRERASRRRRDPKLDDILSWLLVHADTIDQKLDFDRPEPVTGAAKAPDTTNAAASNDFGVGEDFSAVSPNPVNPSPKHVETPAATAPESHHTYHQRDQAREMAPAKQSEEVSYTEEVGPPVVDPSAMVLYAAADPTSVPQASVSPTSAATRDWLGAEVKGETGVSSIGGDGGRSGGGRSDLVRVGLDRGGVSLGARGLVGKLAVAGGIPSDPVLAMQMGARMALAGKLDLIPSGVNDAEVDAGTAAPSTSVRCPVNPLQPTAPIASVIPIPFERTGTISPVEVKTTPGTDINAWTELPPGGTEHSSRISGGGGSSNDIEIEAKVAGAKGDGAGAGYATSDSDDLAGGLGEKRPRTLSLPTAEIKPGRDSFKDGRRRKRMSIGELEERVKQVSEDNARLKLHLSSVNDKMKVMAGRKKAMEAEIAAKLETQGSEPNESNKASLAEALSRFKDLYADYGAQRRRDVHFHLTQLERQIVPTDTTKMSLWTLEQDESFYKDRKRGSLFNILRSELGVSEEQIGRIQERRARIKGLLAELGESLRLVKDLQKSSEAKHAKFEEVMARLQSFFTPQQIARLILWVSANRGHISKLPLLPEHILQERAPAKPAS